MVIIGNAKYSQYHQFIYLFLKISLAIVHIHGVITHSLRNSSISHI